MKIRSCPLFLSGVLGLLSLTNVDSAAADARANAFRINAVEQHNQALIEPGTAQFTVRRVLGEPRRRLNADTWVYENFSACDWKIDTGNCATLVITFKEGKVADLRLVNAAAEKAIAAALRKPLAPSVAAAK